MSATDRHRTALLEQITPVVESLGYEIDDLTVQRVGRRSLVKVVVDGDRGIDLDAIADVSRAVSAALDADDPFDTPFVLEVTSPGIDRPLTEPRHWRRNTGRLVTTVVDETELTARITEVTDAGVVLGLADGTREAPWGQLGPGRVQVEFGRPARGSARDEDEGA